MNIIEIKVLKSGYFTEETTKIISKVSMKQGETPKEYIRRIVKNGNVTDMTITKTGPLHESK